MAIHSSQPETVTPHSRFMVDSFTRREQGACWEVSVKACADVDSSGRTYWKSQAQ